MLTPPPTVTANIQKLEIVRDAMDLAVQCNDTLHNAKVKTYFLEKSTLRKNLLGFQVSRLEKYLDRVYKFFALNTRLSQFNGQDQTILTLLDGNANGAKMKTFEKWCETFESKTVVKGGERPTEVAVMFENMQGFIDPPSDQDELLKLLRTSSGPSVEMEGGDGGE